jgi:hypothetical protein
LGGDGIELVALEGEERADDDSGSGEEEAGRLVDGGLAGAGGLDDESVAAGENGLDCLKLFGAEVG